MTNTQNKNYPPVRLLNKNIIPVFIFCLFCISVNISSAEARTTGKCGNTANTCLDGNHSFSPIDTSTEIRWTCKGRLGGADANCRLSKSVDGKCDVLKNRCSNGRFIDSTDSSSEYKWTCSGQNGGKTDSCSILKPINGTCGSNIDSCSTGDFRTAIDTLTEDRWKCIGKHNGSDTDCRLPKPVDGKCGVLKNKCSNGTFIDSRDSSSEYKWTCSGQNGGKTDSCSVLIPVNGSCGSNIDSCSEGDFRPALDSLKEDRWKCVGKHGGSDDDCSRPKPVDGKCGVLKNKCSNGTFIDSRDSSSEYKWTCSGQNGGKTDSCSVLIPVNGSCGSNIDSCSEGDFRRAVDTLTEDRWKCVGKHGGSDTNCNLPKPIDGKCGVLKNKCSNGTFIDSRDSSSEYKWTCSGQNGGKTDSCSIPISVNGSCGSNIDSCSEGDFRPALDSLKEDRWKCVGKHGGSDTNCNLPKPIDGKCGVLKNRCSNGTFIDSRDSSSEYKWTCSGQNGGKTDSCSIPISVNGTCGSNIDSCSEGDFRPALDSLKEDRWKCIGNHGGSDDDCSRPKPIDGKCGVLKNRCSNGTFIDSRDSSSEYKWTCSGQNGGKTDSCSIPISVNGTCGSNIDSCSEGDFRPALDSLKEDRWKCIGKHSGSDADCKLSKPVDGKCGVLKNRCSNGTFIDSRDSSSEYKWTCSGQNGGKDDLCTSPILIDKGDDNDKAPEVSFTTIPGDETDENDYTKRIVRGQAPFTVAFIDLTETSTLKNPIYAWDFGDGTSSHKTSPEHTFEKGNYDVTLTVTNDNSAVGKAKKTIRAFRAIGKDPDTPDDKENVTADFDYTSTEVREGEVKVKFNNLSLNAKSYIWNFGDDRKSQTNTSLGGYGIPILRGFLGGNTNISYEENPTHTFSKAGEYTVTLTAYQELGRKDNSDTYTLTVKVNAPKKDDASSIIKGNVILNGDDLTKDLVDLTGLIIELKNIRGQVVNSSEVKHNLSTHTYEYQIDGSSSGVNCLGCTIEVALDKIPNHLDLGLTFSPERQTLIRGSNPITIIVTLELNPDTDLSSFSQATGVLRKFFEKYKTTNGREKTVLENFMNKIAERRMKLLIGDDKTIGELNKNNPDISKILASILTKEERINFRQFLNEKWIEKDSGPLEGILSVTIFDTFDNRNSWMEYKLNISTQQTIQLHPAAPIHRPLHSGNIVQASGVLFDTHLLLNFNRPSQETPEKNMGLSVLNTPDFKIFGEQKTIVIPANFQDKREEPFTKDQMHNRIFGENDSIDSFYQDVSFGKVFFSGRVVDWQKLPINATCDTDTILEAVLQKSKETINFKQYERIIIISPLNDLGCDWAGFGTIGKRSLLLNPGESINVTISWLQTQFLYNEIGEPGGAPEHEMGHNFGFHHAQGLDCGDQVFIPENTLLACSIKEPNLYDVMSRRVHPHAANKDIVGWLDDTNRINVKKSNEYTLNPYEDLAKKSLALKIHTTKFWEHFYVEFRQPKGLDKNVYQFDQWSHDPPFGALIMYNKAPFETYLLDGTPNSFDDARKDFYDADFLENMPFSTQDSGMDIVIGPSTDTSLKVEVTIKDSAQLIISPVTEDRNISGKVTLKVSVQDNADITSVKFFRKPFNGTQILDPALLGSDAVGKNAPDTPGNRNYSLSWDTRTVSIGENIFYAEINKADGKVIKTFERLVLLTHSIPVVTTINPTTTSLTQLQATWTPYKPESDIIEYQYRIFSNKIDFKAVGLTEIQGWTSVGLVNLATANNLNLEIGETYTFEVRGKSTTGDFFRPSVSNSITVIPADDENPLPNLFITNFDSSIKKGVAPLTVQFTDTTIGDPDQWIWDFDLNQNNGVESIEQNPMHTYTEPGRYTVFLRSTLSLDTDQEIKTDYIEVLDPAAVIADFDYKVTEIREGVFEVKFKNSSLNAKSFTWNFGDDRKSQTNTSLGGYGIPILRGFLGGNTNISYEENPTHTFSEAGEYTVTLTAYQELRRRGTKDIHTLSVKVGIDEKDDKPIVDDTPKTDEGSLDSFGCATEANGTLEENTQKIFDARRRGDNRGLLDFVRKRKALLIKTMRENPEKALELILPKTVRNLMPEEVRGCVEQEVEVEGVLGISIADYFNEGRADVFYSLTKDKTHFFLYPAQGFPSNVISGSTIKLRGFGIDHHIAFKGRVSTQGSGIEVINSASTSIPSNIKIAAIKVNFQDDQSKPIIDTEINQMVSDVNQLYTSISNGKISSVMADIFGWYTVEMNKDNSYSEDGFGITAGFTNQLCGGDRAEEIKIFESFVKEVTKKADNNIIFQDYTAIVFFIHLDGSCLRKLDTLGGSVKYIDKSIVKSHSKVIIVNTAYNKEESSTLSHELGHHTFEWDHANSWNCVDFSDDSDRCSESYADPWDTMGNRFVLNFNGYRREKAGFFDLSIEAVMEEDSSAVRAGVTTFYPLRAMQEDKPSILKLGRGTNMPIYVEYNKATAFNNMAGVDQGVVIYMAGERISTGDTHLITKRNSGDFIWKKGDVFHDPVTNVAIRMLGVVEPNTFDIEVFLDGGEDSDGCPASTTISALGGQEKFRTSLNEGDGCACEIPFDVGGGAISETPGIYSLGSFDAGKPTVLFIPGADSRSPKDIFSFYLNDDKLKEEYNIVYFVYDYLEKIELLGSQLANHWWLFKRENPVGDSVTVIDHSYGAIVLREAMRFEKEGEFSGLKAIELTPILGGSNTARSCFAPIGTKFTKYGDITRAMYPYGDIQKNLFSPQSVSQFNGKADQFVIAIEGDKHIPPASLPSDDIFVQNYTRGLGDNFTSLPQITDNPHGDILFDQRAIDIVKRELGVQNNTFDVCPASTASNTLSVPTKFRTSLNGGEGCRHPEDYLIDFTYEVLDSQTVQFFNDIDGLDVDLLEWRITSTDLNDVKVTTTLTEIDPIYTLPVGSFDDYNRFFINLIVTDVNGFKYSSGGDVVTFDTVDPSKRTPPVKLDEGFEVKLFVEKTEGNEIEIYSQMPYFQMSDDFPQGMELTLALIKGDNVFASKAELLLKTTPDKLYFPPIDNKTHDLLATTNIEDPTEPVYITLRVSHDVVNPVTSKIESEDSEAHIVLILDDEDTAVSGPTRTSKDVLFTHEFFDSETIQFSGDLEVDNIEAIDWLWSINAENAEGDLIAMFVSNDDLGQNFEYSIIPETVEIKVNLSIKIDDEQGTHVVSKEEIIPIDIPDEVVDACPAPKGLIPSDGGKTGQGLLEYRFPDEKNNPGQVSFKVSHVDTTKIMRWEFGDGVTQPGGITATRFYDEADRYTVNVISKNLTVMASQEVFVNRGQNGKLVKNSSFTRQSLSPSQFRTAVTADGQTCPNSLPFDNTSDGSSVTTFIIDPNVPTAFFREQSTSGRTVTYEDVSTGQVTGREWKVIDTKGDTLDDNDTVIKRGNNAVFEHAFNDGSYRVELTVSNKFGGHTFFINVNFSRGLKVTPQNRLVSESDFFTVEDSPFLSTRRAEGFMSVQASSSAESAPIADFKYYQRSFDPQEKYYFQSTSVGGGMSSHVWKFRNLKTGTETVLDEGSTNHREFTFMEKGRIVSPATYEVTLTVKNNLGQDAITKTVEWPMMPYASSVWSVDKNIVAGQNSCTNCLKVNVMPLYNRDWFDAKIYFERGDSLGGWGPADPNDSFVKSGFLIDQPGNFRSYTYADSNPANKRVRVVMNNKMQNEHKRTFTIVQELALPKGLDNRDNDGPVIDPPECVDVNDCSSGQKCNNLGQCVEISPPGCAETNCFDVFNIDSVTLNKEFVAENETVMLSIIVTGTPGANLNGRVYWGDGEEDSFNNGPRNFLIGSDGTYTATATTHEYKQSNFTKGLAPYTENYNISVEVSGDDKTVKKDVPVSVNHAGNAAFSIASLSAPSRVNIGKEFEIKAEISTVKTVNLAGRLSWGDGAKDIAPFTISPGNNFQINKLKTYTLPLTDPKEYAIRVKVHDNNYTQEQSKTITVYPDFWIEDGNVEINNDILDGSWGLANLKATIRAFDTTQTLHGSIDYGDGTVETIESFTVSSRKSLSYSHPYDPVSVEENYTVTLKLINDQGLSITKTYPDVKVIPQSLLTIKNFEILCDNPDGLGTVACGSDITSGDDVVIKAVISSQDSAIVKVEAVVDWGQDRVFDILAEDVKTVRIRPGQSETIRISHKYFNFSSESTRYPIKIKFFQVEDILDEGEIFLEKERSITINPKH